MITAKEARDLSDNLQTQRAKDCLCIIETNIRDRASKGHTTLDVTELNPLSSVLLYLESIGYVIDKLKGEKHDTNLNIVVSW